MEDSLNVFCGLATGALIKGIALSWVGGKKRKEYVGTVSRLLIYPLKSSREMEDVREAELTKHGLKVNGAVDRHWMVTKKDGSYYTLMNNTRLTLIRSRVKDGCLCLTASGCEPLQLPLDPAVEPDSIKTVVVKFAPILALDCGDRAAAWICKVLQKEELRLFYSAPSLDKRPSIEVAKDWPTPIKPNVKVAFQEWVPCMLMSESSVAALNKRLEKPVTCINFRPNVMVEGTHPFDEDNWREVFIGDKVHLRYVDHCVRFACLCFFVVSFFMNVSRLLLLDMHVSRTPQS